MSHIVKLLNETQKELQSLEALLEKQRMGQVEGQLRCDEKKQHYYYFKRIKEQNGCRLVYIPKRNLAAAKALAQKKYLTQLKKMTISNISLIDRFLKDYLQDGAAGVAERLPKGYAPLIQPISTSREQYVSQWQNAKYDTNPFHPEQLIQLTLRGEKVRSKSEALIAGALFGRGIPYRYECALQLQDGIIYPDFTIMNPFSQEIFYYEHFGMLDNAEYADHACSKIRRYIENGIFPAEKLLSTWETRSHPLNPQTVNKIISTYLSK